MPDPKNKMLVVALSGKMHSGKTSIADYLVAKHGFRRLTFAGPLKEDIRKMEFSDQNIAAKPDWMRKLMQAYGQARRAEDPDHWISELLNSLAALSWAGDPVVIDDMRFLNEARALVKTGGLFEWDLRLIRVGRWNYDRSHLEGAHDESETDLDAFDHWDESVWAGSGDLEALYRQICFFLKLPYQEALPLGD